MVNPAGAIQRVAFFCLKRWIRLCHPAVTSITPEQLQRILAGEEQGDWLILDARSPAEFAPGGHYGLLGMHERSELAGGKFSITSSEAGTIIQVVFEI